MATKETKREIDTMALNNNERKLVEDLELLIRNFYRASFEEADKTMTEIVEKNKKTADPTTDKQS